MCTDHVSHAYLVFNHLQDQIFFLGGGGGGGEGGIVKDYLCIWQHIHMHCREPGYVVKHAVVSKILLVELKNSRILC